jgi:hypothetical protein
MSLLRDLMRVFRNMNLDLLRELLLLVPCPCLALLLQGL